MAEAALRNSPAAKVRRIAKLWEDHEPHFKQHWLAMASARDFCFKAQHYSVQARIDLQRKNRIAPITDDTGDLVRFKADQVATSEIYLDVEPDVPAELEAPMPSWDAGLGDFKAPELQPSQDPQFAKWALERDVLDPLVGYDLVRLRVALDGFGARAGCYVLDWDPTQGKRGRIFPKVLNPAGQIMWHSSYNHPHEPGNYWLIIREFPQVEDAKATWPKAAEFLKPDAAIPPEMRSWAEPLPILPHTAGQITILKCYELYDGSKKRAMVPSYEPEMLPPAEQYLACEQCDWESGPLGSIKAKDTEACPECGGNATKIKVSGKLVPTAAFLKGKRYTVVAPNCPEAGELDSRGWPGDPPTFPVFYFVPGVHPHEPTGMSDTERNSDIQCAMDAAFRIGYEQMQRNRDYLFMRRATFEDETGEPYQFDATSDYVGYVDSSEPIDSLIKHFQGSGMPDALPSWLGLLTERFRSTRGIGQLGASPDTLKGVQVGVAERYMDAGDVPVDTALKIFRWGESIVFTCWHAMQRNLYTKGDWIAMIGKNGEKGFMAMRGEDIPAARIKVTGKPSVNASDMEQMKNLMDVMSRAAALSPATLEIALQAGHFPQAWVEKLMKERKQAAPQPGTGPGPGSAGPGTAPVPQMNGAPAILAGR